MSDVEVFLETKPELAKDEMRDAFENSGDYLFRDAIKSQHINTEWKGICAANIQIFTKPGDDDLEQLAREVEVFMQRELNRRGIEVTNITATAVFPQEELPPVGEL